MIHINVYRIETCFDFTTDYTKSEACAHIVRGVFGAIHISIFAYSESKLTSYFVVVVVVVGVLVVVGRKVEKVGKRSEDVIGMS